MPSSFKTTPEDNTATTGWALWRGGMMHVEDFTEIATDEAHTIINGQTRRLGISPRPGFRWQREWSDNPRVIELFRNGSSQCSWAFNDRVVYGIDGHLITFDPETGQLCDLGQFFNPLADNLYFAERGGGLVVGDGENPPVFVSESFVPRRLNDSKEVPIGLSMVDDGRRLWVLSSDGRRLYASNHRLDPINDDPLRFDEASQYFLNAPYIELPEKIGCGVALAIFPNSDEDYLVVFGTRGAQFYRAEVPRAEWISVDITSTALEDIGTTSPRTVVRRGFDLYFSDQKGRIRSLSTSTEDEKNPNLLTIDRGVWAIYEDDPKELLKFRQSVLWKDWLLTTIRPCGEWIDDDRMEVSHRGLAVLNFDISRSDSGTRRHVWDGIWTGPRATDLTVLNERLFIRSRDADGVARIYEADTELEYDIAPNWEGRMRDARIHMQVGLRQTDFGAPMIGKKTTQGAATLSRMRGRTTVCGGYRANRHPKVWSWFRDEDYGDRSLKCIEECEKSILDGGQGIEQQNFGFGNPKDDGENCVNGTDYSVWNIIGLWFSIVGYAHLEKVAMDVMPEELDFESPDCGEPEAGRAVRGCGPDLWEYHFLGAREDVLEGA